jgi:hypothetical protein
MSARNAIVPLLSVSILLFLAGCGGGGSHSSTPPPTGGFTKANFNGTYVVSFSGTDITPTSSSSGSFFAVAGTLTANGSGGLTGTLDINDPELAVATGANTSVATSVATSGSYSVSSDGRGSGTITVTFNGTKIPMGIDFVLSSSSGGLITRFDKYGTGSGTLDLQTSGVTQASLVGSYSVGLNGIDANGDSLGLVGSITLAGSGAATGTEDMNDNGTSINLTNLALTTPSAVTVGSPGTANLTANAGSLASLSFDVWVIDATHFKLIETDSTAYLAGDAFVSTGNTAFPSGNLAYTMSDEDASAGGLLVGGGVLTSDGTSTITAGLEDINAGGTPGSAPSVTGTFTSVGGRTQLNLAGIYTIVGGSVGSGTFGFAAYPYNGGIFLLEDDSDGSGNGALVGTAYAQSATSLTASSGYGLNLSGVDESSSGSSEVDMIAEFSTDTGGDVSGLYDVNNEGLLISGYSLGNGATYTNNSNGRGTIAFPNLETNSSNSFVSSIGLTYYAVNSSTAIFIENDSTGQVATGIIELQSSTSGGSSAVSPTHFMAARPIFLTHAARQKKN